MTEMGKVEGRTDLGRGREERKIHLSRDFEVSIKYPIRDVRHAVICKNRKLRSKYGLET